MIRKYHNHKPQTTLWYREEEPLNHHETPGRQTKQSNQAPPLPIKMIAIPEWTQSNIQQNNRTSTGSHNESKKKQKSKQQQNHRLRTDSSLSHWGA